MKHKTTTGKLLAGSILEDQIRLESSAVDAGVRRYRRLVKEAIERDDGAALKPAERLLLHWLRPLEAAIKEEKRDARRIGKKTNKSSGSGMYAQVMQLCSAERMAVITIRCALSACMAEYRGVPVVRLAYTIGRDVIAEINFDTMKSRDYRSDYRELCHRLRRIRTTHVNHWANKTLDDPIWRRKVCAHLGVRLLWLLIGTASCGNYDDQWQQAWHHEKVWYKEKQKAYIRLDETAASIIEDGHLWRQYMRPRYLPMVVKPYPWQKNTQGGYVRIRTPFITKPTPMQKTALAESDLSQVHACLNSLGETPWRVNKRIYETMTYLWETGGGAAGIPHAEDGPIPPRPANYEDSEEAKEKWRREARNAHKRNESLKANRREFLNKLNVAEQMMSYERFYLPHQLDFRGRCYAIPIHLNHQGDDVCRGLLEFAEARPMTDRAIYWLKVHIANCFGYNKASYDQRVEWTDLHMDDIERAALHPISNLDWWRFEPSGKPRKEAWQLLAACMAMFDEKAAEHLPIQLDGTCNGLQHYAAMGRDEIGGATVNLVPSDAPSDIYTDVAVACKPRIMRDAEAGKPEALMVVDHIGRDLVKQPVMTSVYGVTRVGARQQVLAKLLKLNLDDEATRSDVFRASIYLSEVVLDAIKEVCIGANKIMSWLKQVAETISKPPTEREIRWTTPLGMPVLQPYRNYGTVKIQTVLQNLTLMVDDETVPVRTCKQMNGMAPNYVHSLDATHMMMTARAMRKLDKAFAGVHDSFWTHAADVDLMARVLREQFVAIHSKPLLTSLRTELQNRYHIELPSPPEPGNLDINCVLKSDYFFS